MVRKNREHLLACTKFLTNSLAPRGCRTIVRKLCEALAGMCLDVGWRKDSTWLTKDIAKELRQMPADDRKAWLAEIAGVALEEQQEQPRTIDNVTARAFDKFVTHHYQDCCFLTYYVLKLLPPPEGLQIQLQKDKPNKKSRSTRSLHSLQFLVATGIGCFGRLQVSAGNS